MGSSIGRNRPLPQVAVASGRRSKMTEQATTSIAVRYPALAPNGLYYGAHQYLHIQDTLERTFASASRRLAPVLRKIYGNAPLSPAWTLQPADLVFVFNGSRRAPDETFQHALDAAVSEHGAQECSQPLATHPDVRMVLSVIITNSKLPKAALQPRVPADQFHQMVRSGTLRLTHPIGDPADPGAPSDPTDPCPVCLFDMRGIDGVLLACGHALHMDCISGWANAAAVPSCPLCRTPCTH